MKLARWQANIMLLLTAMIWGTTYTFIKQAYEGHMTAGMMNAIRGFIYALLIFVFFHRIIRQMTRDDFRIGLIAGIINFLGYQIQTIGLNYTTPSKSAFLTATYVVMIPFIVWLFLHQRPAGKSYLAIAICFVGTLFLTNTIQTGFNFKIGDTLTLLSAFVFAAQIVYFSSKAAESNPFTVAFMLGIVQGVASLIWSLIFERGDYSSINWSVSIWPVLILAVFASFGAQTMQVVGQKFTDSTSSGLILMTESLFGSLFSVLMGFDPLTSNLLIGGALIVVAIFMMEFSLKNIVVIRKRRRLGR